MVGGVGPGALHEEPVWYRPLMSPDWLLPPHREGAPRVLFVPEAPVPDPSSNDERDLGIGLPMYLAEAVRFSMDVATAARPVPDPTGETDTDQTWDRRVVTSISLSAEGVVRARLLDEATGGELATTEAATTDEQIIEEALAGLPAKVTDALRAHGAVPVWAPVYSSPAPGHARRYVLAHVACLRLRQPSLHEQVEDPDERKSRREVARGLLAWLADFATRTSAPFPAMLFFAGLCGAHAAGNEAAGEFRLQANALCMEATEPLDPVFRMSALVLRILGDVGMAEQRARKLAGSGDPALTRWLTKIAAAR